MEWIDILQYRPSEGETVLVLTRALTVQTMTYSELEGSFPHFTEERLDDYDGYYGYYRDPEVLPWYHISHWATYPFDEDYTEEELAADVSRLFKSSAVDWMDAEAFMETYNVDFRLAHKVLRRLVEKGTLKRRRVDNRFVYERNDENA